MVIVFSQPIRQGLLLENVLALLSKNANCRRLLAYVLQAGCVPG